MNKARLYYLLFILLSLLACGSPDRLERALTMASSNRGELEKVLHHYSQSPHDSLKLKAAVFLIENMPQHAYYRHNVEYFPIMDSLNKSDISMNELYAKHDSLRRYLTPSKPERHLDIKTLSSDFLIAHINKIFEVWQNNPWYDINRFDDFCEYILPYSVSSEKRELWTEYYHNKYVPYLSDYLSSNDSASSHDFCQKLNERFISERKMITHNNLLNNYPPLMVDNIKAGICDDYAGRMVYIMRSMGIPIGVDFSPHWRGYILAHSWNILIGDSGRRFPFMGFDETISQWKVPSPMSASKFYRVTYSAQKESLAGQNIEKNIPGFLKQANIIDVTSEYIPVININVAVKNNKSRGDSKVAYICVFKDSWAPVHWGRIKNNRVAFTNMGSSPLYLPAYYTDEGIVEANDPFIIDSIGGVHHITPHPTKKETLRLERKYPLSVKTEMFLNRMLNGKFQGSNDPDFKNCDDLYTITERPEMLYCTVPIRNNKRYRYVRYIGGPDSFTNIAEVEFYTQQGNSKVKLSGKVIGTDNDTSIDDRGYTKEKAFDGDVLTFFNSTFDIQAWVGLDLKTPTSIDQIRFLPRNDDNNIRIGDVYELVYWENNRWNSLGKKEADDHILIYDNCPAGALYMLHNHTRGKEERIFTYVNGQQIWY